MADFTQLVSPLVRDLVWQSTAILLVALVVVRYLVRQPARAHAVLLLALLAAIIAPLTSEVVRRRGWGMIAAEPISTASELALLARPNTLSPPAERPSMNLNVPGSAEEQSQFEPGVAQSARAAALGDGKAASPALSIDPSSRSSQGTTAFAKSLRSWAAYVAAPLGGSWLLVSLVLGLRLLRGAGAGLRLIGSAEPCQATSVLDSLAIARLQLDLDGLPIRVYESPLVRCPMIWCWGRGPKLLLPIEAVQTWPRERSLPILCHELAHWKRRDHLSALVAELVCAIVPWQPLAWIAKRRLEQASEEACDDWTVAAGHSPVDYAEALLGLVAQTDPPLALAALRRRSGLASRVRHIVSQAVPRPRLGRLWTAAALSLAIVGVGVTAVCQRGVARAESDAKSSTAKSESEAPATSTVGGQKMHTVFGRILDPEGNPVPDVQVTWEGFTQAAPRGIEEWPTGRRERLASVKTEADGRFRCQAMFAADRYSFTSLPIRSERYGFRARHVDMKKLDEPIEVSLEETYPIEGTILSSTAEPVVGARVLIRRVHRYDVADPREANWSRGLEQPEHYSKTYPDYWPAPVTTDAEGRFRIEGIVPLSAACELEISRDGYPPTVVHIAGKESKRDRTWEYTDSKFTLVLEDPLIVHGRFTDEKSGEGIAGVKVDVMPFTTGHGGSTLDRVETTSDVEGRYMLRWGRADSHWLRVFPPLGYAGMTDSISAKDVEKLTVKPGVVDYPVKLRPGKVIRGKVIVEGTDEPVADVEVVYHGVRNRKYGTNNDFLPVKTAVDGSFELTGADGQGFLLVNAPKRGFYREHFTHERLFNRNGIYPHGYLEVDIPTEKNAEGFVVPVRHGAVLTIHCLDPSGKPAGNLMAAHAEQEFDGRFQTTYCAGNEYLIDAARPERTYRVFLYSRDSNSGKVVELVAPVDGQPVDVKLEPCATIRGRYVYENGTGVSEVANASHFRMDPSKPLDGDRIYDLPFYDNFAQSHDRKGRVTDSEGNFRLDNIVPGVFMYLSINYPFADGKHFREVGMLAPGEVKDLGEMVLRPN